MEKFSTKLEDAFLLKTTLFRDDRGSFNRLFCQKSLLALGLIDGFVQSNLCINNKAGIVRGLHYQLKPHEETKIVTCLEGKIYDVIVDLRPSSPTYLQWEGFELSCPHTSLYVPKGFAHGYQTLVDNSIVHYSVDEFYSPDSEQGIRYDDPHLNIKWKLPICGISYKDSAWPMLN